MSKVAVCTTDNGTWQLRQIAKNFFYGLLSLFQNHSACRLWRLCFPLLFLLLFAIDYYPPRANQSHTIFIVLLAGRSPPFFCLFSRSLLPYIEDNVLRPSECIFSESIWQNAFQSFLISFSFLYFHSHRILSAF